MWGEINNKPTTVKESYCLGEACLIFQYGNGDERTIAFKSKEDLRRAKEFVLSRQRDFFAKTLDNNVIIDVSNAKIELALVNNTHADRLKDVLESLKR